MSATDLSKGSQSKILMIKSEENSGTGVPSVSAEPESRKRNEINSNDTEDENSNQSPSNKNDNEDNSNKKQRTNYRDPARLANIKAAIDFLLQQENAEDETTNTFKNKNLKEVSRQFKIPYNTLRDNFLRATTGQVRHSSVKQVLKNRKDVLGNNLMGPSSMMFADSSQLFPMHIPFPMAPLGMHGGPNQPLFFQPQQQAPSQQQSQQQSHNMAYSMGNGPVVYFMPYNSLAMQGKQGQPNFIRMNPSNNGAALSMSAMPPFQNAATQMHVMSGTPSQFIHNPNNPSMPEMMFQMPHGSDQMNTYSSMPPGLFFRHPNISHPNFSFEPTSSASHSSFSSSSFDSSAPTLMKVATPDELHNNQIQNQSQQQALVKEGRQEEKRGSSSPPSAHVSHSLLSYSPSQGVDH